MSYLFVPPVVDEGPMGGNYLFARYTRKQGVCVYRVDGEWFEDRFPSQDELALADRVYLGGHEHPVSASEKAELEAVGYTVFTV